MKTCNFSNHKVEKNNKTFFTLSNIISANYVKYQMKLNYYNIQYNHNIKLNKIKLKKKHIYTAL